MIRFLNSEMTKQNMLLVSQFHFVYYVQHCDNDGFGRLTVLSTEYNTHLTKYQFIIITKVLIDYVSLGLGLFFLYAFHWLKSS